jgi:eukaryotic-like serine/threonine-protein kinase
MIAIKNLKSLTFKKSFLYTLISLSLILSLINPYLLCFSRYVMGEEDNSLKNSHFLLYENPIHKVKIKYPSNWTITDKSNIGQLSVKFSSADGGHYPSLFLETYDLSNNGNNISLEGYAQNETRRLFDSLLDFNLVEMARIAISDETGEKAEYTFTLNHVPFKKMEIWVMKGDKIYAINYVAEESKFSRYLPVIEKMVGSFFITKQ